MEDCRLCQVFALSGSWPYEAEDVDFDWSGSLSRRFPVSYQNSVELCNVCRRTLATPCTLSPEFSEHNFLPFTVLQKYDGTPHLGFAPIPHQPSFASLRESAWSGCVICLAIVKALLREHGRSHVNNYGWAPQATGGNGWFTAARIIAQKYEKEGFLHVDFTPNILHDGSWWWICPFDLVPLPDDRVMELKKSARDRFVDVTGDAVKWIQNCCVTQSLHQTKHEAIASKSHRLFTSTTPDFYPTRLLEIKTSGADIVGSVQLVETRETRCMGGYAALSHCWGTKSFVVNNKTTYNDLKKGVSVQILSKTLRDAIQVTSALGLRYIWIDSLCIIQDDKEDWLIEGAAMGQVYAQACVTLRATASVDGDGGLLLDELGILAGRIAQVDLLKPGQAYLVTRPEIYQWIEEVDRQPLQSRAWVLQESLLSSRLIHFSRGEVFFECGHEIRSEARPDSDWTKDYAYTVGREISLYAMRRFENEKASYLRMWMQIVEVYSSKKLTYPGDRLIAVSALARLIANHDDNMEYYAGLFRPQLARQLLWSGNGHRLADRIAPTWSWASITTGVSYDLREFNAAENEDHFRLLVSVDAEETKPSRGDRFIDGTGIQLRIQGNLLPLAWVDLGCFETEIRFVNARGDVHSVRFKLYPKFDESGFDKAAAQKIDIWYLPILIRYARSENKLYGILLTSGPDTTSALPQFQRIGFASEYDSLFGCLGLTGRGKLLHENGRVAEDVEASALLEREWLSEQKLEETPYNSNTEYGYLDFVLV